MATRCIGPGDTYGIAGVVVDITTAESTAGIDFTLAPFSWGKLAMALPHNFAHLSLIPRVVDEIELGSMVLFVCAATKLARRARAAVDRKSILARWVSWERSEGGGIWFELTAKRLN
jgi:hypothetical protein